MSALSVNTHWDCRSHQVHGTCSRARRHRPRSAGNCPVQWRLVRDRLYEEPAFVRQRRPPPRLLDLATSARDVVRSAAQADYVCSVYSVARCATRDRPNRCLLTAQLTAEIAEKRLTQM